jgi:uncharacterized YigZ family protein
VVSSYLVPAGDASAWLEVKRSRFLATVTRVHTEAAARAVVEAARREHWDARHHCSAFVLGPRGEIARSSDDGEPAGTAGAPMLEVLRGAADGRGVSDVVAVVTRWFGGVLLGAGGLVRAYGDAVRAALEVSGTVERRLLVLSSVTVGHAVAARLENDLRNRGVVVHDVAYGAAVTLTLATPPGLAIGAVVSGLTSGEGRVVPVGEEWVEDRR